MPTFDNARKLKFEPEKAYPPEPGNEWLGVKLALSSASADRQDERPASHLLRPSMIRVVGTTSSGDPAQYIPRILGDVAIDGQDSPLRAVDLDNNFNLKDQRDLTAYFEVPTGFKPWFVEYRRHARKELTPSTKAEVAPAIASAAEAPAHEAERPVTPGRRVGASGFMDHVEADGTGVSDRLPIRIALAAARGDFEQSGTTLLHGRITGRVGDLRAAVGTAALREFAVPRRRQALADPLPAVSGALDDWPGLQLRRPQFEHLRRCR